jgi:hypothetical protein
MAVMPDAPEVEGAKEILNWFGYWPAFHDAEVLTITLERRSGCRVVIHAFEKTSDVDSRGYYVLAKHALVTFTMEGFPAGEDGVVNTEIAAFNHQNVLFGAEVAKIPNGYALRLDGIFGVTGQICGERLRVSVEPWKPMPISTDGFAPGP